MRKSKKWTEEEKEYLIKNYRKKRIAEIASHLKRSYSSVYARVYGLDISDNAKWREEYKKWELINKILNTLRQAKGLPLVAASENPYKDL